MTSTLKGEVIDLIIDLPEETTLDEIIYHLYVKKKIAKGLEELRERKGILHEAVMKEAKERLKKWLK